MVLNLPGEVGDTARHEEEAWSTGQVPGRKESPPAGNKTEMWPGSREASKDTEPGQGGGRPLFLSMCHVCRVCMCPWCVHEGGGEEKEGGEEGKEEGDC